ncbi:DUF4158 domain-containing protein [Saccharopolyspora spinosa]|uniref:DUF4158 domain-containing protein n=1 Tax=Saccharopolyspora spinosa TaxID=60894 RepID=UPI00117B25BE|nr:DUF4158 domain-containing protein [Saccharopolyspora spinosa]
MITTGGAGDVDEVLLSEEVAERLGWRLANDAEWKDPEEFLLAWAMERDSPSVAFRLVCEYCASARNIGPAWCR